MVELELAPQQQHRAAQSSDRAPTHSKLDGAMDQSPQKLKNPQVEAEGAELVAQARQLLRAEFERSPASYSAAYYDELMDADSPATCWRFLAHSQRDLGEALELMKGALTWRREYQLDALSNRENAKEFWLHGPLHWTGVDRANNDVLYVLGRNYRKPEPELKSHIRRYVANVLFSWDWRHRRDLAKCTLVFDVTDTGLRNIDLDFTAWVISIRDYLPARFHQIYIVGIPLLIRPIIRMIIGWLPDSFKRITHCGTMEQLVHANIDRDQLPVEAGGERADEHYRLAPADAPWACESEVFATPAMLRAIEDCIGFALSPERKEQLDRLQRDHEAKSQAKDL